MIFQNRDSKIDRIIMPVIFLVFYSAKIQRCEYNHFIRLSACRIDQNNMNASDLHPDISQLLGKNLLFIDLETTGFPKKANVPNGGKRIYENLKAYDSSRIIQIGYCYYEHFIDDFQIIMNDIISVIVRPSRPREFNLGYSSKVHGISKNNIIKNGKPLAKILNADFGKCIMNCDYIISYSTAFDIPILASELFRVGFMQKYNALLNLIDDGKVFCMNKLSNKIFGESTKQKVAYLKCYGEEPDNQHDAKGDVYAMLMILKYMIGNKITSMMDSNINTSRIGSPWNKAEEDKLIDEYTIQGLGVVAISEIHKRATGGIVSRLKKLNVIDDKKDARLNNATVDETITITKKEYDELLNFKYAYIDAMKDNELSIVKRPKIATKR